MIALLKNIVFRDHTKTFVDYTDCNRRLGTLSSITQLMNSYNFSLQIFNITLNYSNNNLLQL